MSFINPLFLTKPDKWNRPPAHLFQIMKPLPHVMRFMKRWYPDLLSQSTPSSNLSSALPLTPPHISISVTSPKKKMSLCLSSSDDDHHSDSDSDLERSSSPSFPSPSVKKKNSSRLRNSLSSYCCCSSSFLCRRLSLPQLNSFSRTALRCLSSLISKNSEELSKFPFRCFFGSILLSLYYVLFVFYPPSLFFASSSSSSPPLDVAPLPLYKTTSLFLANLLGQLWMWSSFLTTHFIGKNCTSLPLPEVCHQEYYGALISLVRFYSTPPSSATSASAIPRLPSVCHLCRLLLPLRAKHCKEENVCLLTFDHYCSFLWSPIYRHNYLYFFFYLLAMVCYIPTFLFTSASYIRDQQPPSRALAYFLIWCLLQWIFVLSLLFYLTQSLSLGQTTYERIKQPFYLNSQKMMTMATTMTMTTRRRTKSKSKTSTRSPFSGGSVWKNLLQYREEMCSYGAEERYLKREELNRHCHIFFQLEELLNLRSHQSSDYL
jgi:hypothetical protein